MSKKIIIFIVLVVIVVAGIVFLVGRKNNSTVPVGTAVSPAQVVDGFGKKLQAVSLQGSIDQARQSLVQNYAPYVAPELISQWIANPGMAPGRVVSSPWPDRIEISSVGKNPDGSYSVQGNIVEITSKEAVLGGAADRKPVSLQLENRNGQWLITKFSQGSAVAGASTTKAVINQSVNVRGVLVCLPHKNTNGPQTMECAYGLKDEQGKYYGLRDTDPMYKNISGVPMGQPVVVKGILTPGQDKIYQSIGTIQVNSITRLGK